PQQFQRLALVAVLERVFDPVEVLQLETQRFGVAFQHPGSRLDEGFDAGIEIVQLFELPRIPGQRGPQCTADDVADQARDDARYRLADALAQLDAAEARGADRTREGAVEFGLGLVELLRGSGLVAAEAPGDLAQRGECNRRGVTPDLRRQRHRRARLAFVAGQALAVGRADIDPADIDEQPPLSHQYRLRRPVPAGEYHALAGQREVVVTVHVAVDAVRGARV